MTTHIADEGDNLRLLFNEKQPYNSQILSKWINDGSLIECRILHVQPHELNISINPYSEPVKQFQILYSLKLFLLNFGNPFRNTLGSSKFPHAPTFRRTLFEKISHVFYIFSGSFFDQDRNNHLGLFDYATCGIAYGLGKLFFKASEAGNRSAYVSVPLLFLLNLPFVILRYGIAALLTLPVSLIVVVVDQLFDFFKGKELKEKACQLPIKLIHHEYVKVTPTETCYSTRAVKTTLEDTTLGEYMTKQGISFEDLVVVPASTTNEQEKAEFRLNFRREIQGASAGMMCQGCMGGEEHIDFYYSTVLSQPLNYSSAKNEFEAILGLDIGGAASFLEKENPARLNELATRLS